MFTVVTHNQLLVADAIDVVVFLFASRIFPLYFDLDVFYFIPVDEISGDVLLVIVRLFDYFLLMSKLDDSSRCAVDELLLVSLVLFCFKPRAEEKRK